MSNRQKSGLENHSICTLGIALFWLIQAPTLSQCLEAALVEGNSTSSSINPDTPTYLCCNTSFDISAPSFLPTQSQMRECSLPATAKNHIVVIQLKNNGNCNYEEWIKECETQKCSGVVFFDDMNPRVTGWTARTTAVYPGQPSYSNAAVVGMEAIGPDAEWVIQHIFIDGTGVATSTETQLMDSGVVIRIRSGEINLNTLVIESMLFQIVSCVNWIHSFLNTSVAAAKLAVFVFYLRCSNETPTAVISVLIPEICSNFIRGLTFLDLATWKQTWFEYSITRVLFALPITLGQCSMTAISVILYNVYSRAAYGETSEDGGSRRWINLGVGAVILIATLDISHSIYTVFAFEILPGTLLVAVYTLANIPLSLAFIRYGRAAARLLNSENDSLQPRERLHRIRFAKRVRLAGITMVCHTFWGVVFLLFSNTSTGAWMFIFAIEGTISATQSTLQITAVRWPEQQSKVLPMKLSMLSPSVLQKQQQRSTR